MKILNPLPLQYLKVERLRQKLLEAYERQETQFPALDGEGRPDPLRASAFTRKDPER